MTGDAQYRRDIRKIMKELVDVRRLAQAQNAPQLGFSSIDVGSLDVRDGGKIRTWVTMDDDTEYVSTSLGGTDPQSFEIYNDESQSPTFSVSPTGDVAANSVSVATDITLAGTPLSEALQTAPAGVVARADFTGQVQGVTIQPGGAVTPVGQFMVELRPNREYLLMMPWRGYINSDTGDDVHQTINFYMSRATGPNSEPPDPTINDAYIGSQGQRWAISPNVGVSDSLVTSIVTDDPAGGAVVSYKFLLGLWAQNGTFSPDTDPQRITMWRASLFDMGPVPDPAPVTAPGAVPKQTYTSTWTATDSAIYMPDGSVAGRTDILNQGVTLGDGLARYSAFICGGKATKGETGKTMSQALTAGTEIQKVEIGLGCVWTERNVGGSANFSWLNRASLPSTWTDGFDRTAASLDFKSRNQWQWFKDPQQNSSAAFDPLTTRGAFIGTTFATGPQFHIHLAGSTYDDKSMRPQIRVTYTR